MGVFKKKLTECPFQRLPANKTIKITYYTYYYNSTIAYFYRKSNFAVEKENIVNIVLSFRDLLKLKVK